MGRPDDTVWRHAAESAEGGGHASELCGTDCEGAWDEQRSGNAGWQREGEGREGGGQEAIAWGAHEDYCADGDCDAVAEQAGVKNSRVGKGCTVGACCAQSTHTRFILFIRARFLLSQGAVYYRAVRLTHPPVLQRGTQKFTYGPGANASWNSTLAPASANTPVPGKGKDKEKDKEKEGVNGMANGKEKEKEKEREKEGSRLLPDARLYATWEYEQKRYDQPLVMKRRVGSMTVHTGGGSVARARSESTNV